MQCLVHFPFSSYDVEPCPVLNLHLPANSLTILKSHTLPPITSATDLSPTSPKIAFTVKTTIQPFWSETMLISQNSCCHGPAKHMRMHEQQFLLLPQTLIWAFWIPFFWVSSTGSTSFPSHQPTTELSQASSSSTCGSWHYVPNNNIFI